jgi:hypothetical protein
MAQLKKVPEETGKVKQPIELRKLPEKVFLYLMELLIPAFIAAVIMYYLSGSVQIPSPFQGMIPWIYALVLVLFSLVIAVLYTEIPRIARRLEANPKRFIKTGISGLGVPVIALIAAILFTLPNGQTYLAYYLPTSLIQGKLPVPNPSISAAILQSSDLNTKIVGINTLGAIRDPENLNQLTQILTQQTKDLENPVYYQALSQSIAQYGVGSKTALINQFYHWSTAISPSASVSGLTLYDQYFAMSIQALRASISSQDLTESDKNTQLQSLNALENNLKSDLGYLKVSSTGATSGDIRLDFILDTFYRMPIQQDADILSLAKGVAANPVYLVLDRKKAILLIGKLGSQDDLALISSYLQNSSDVIKTGALEALVVLDQKLHAIPSSSTPVPAPN